MQAVILVGGKGTRISGMHPDLPKALVPVAGKPFLMWQLEWLMRGGVSQVHLAAGHLAGKLEEWIEQRPIEGLDMSLSVEPSALGTAGGLKWVEPFIETDTFYVINGDSLLPALDFSSFMEAHMTGAGLATLAITHIEEAGRYGTVEFDEKQRLEAFREKEDRAGGWINAGVYAMSTAILDEIEADQNLSLETDVFPKLAAAGSVHVHASDPPLLDMGTPDGLSSMESYLAG